MAVPATSSNNSTAEPRLCLSAVDEALLLLLARRLARALLLEAEADMATEITQPRLDSVRPASHS
jgi:hypothetical protein